MSPDYERLLGRAVSNKDFRDKLLADPEGAVKQGGFNITSDELRDLKKGINNLQTDSSQLDSVLGAKAGGGWV